MNTSLIFSIEELLLRKSEWVGGWGQGKEDMGEGKGAVVSFFFFFKEESLFVF